jgi:hypothetical protein
MISRRVTISRPCQRQLPEAEWQHVFGHTLTRAAIRIFLSDRYAAPCLTGCARCDTLKGTCQDSNHAGTQCL